MNSSADITNLVHELESSCILKFTCEHEVNMHISFLDINIQRNCESNKFDTSVHIKTTDSGNTMNFDSFAPLIYKKAVIKSYAHRALSICSSWKSVRNELDRVKQNLVNNNYPNKVIDDVFKSVISSHSNTKTDVSNTEQNIPRSVSLYFKNQWSSSAKREENDLKTIVHKNVSSVKPVEQFSVKVHYKTTKLASVFGPKRIFSGTDHVVYEHKCRDRACNGSAAYIGYTLQDLSKRISQHKQSGSIKEHINKIHNFSIPLESNSFNIIFKSSEKHTLQIAEALLIKEHKPLINIQTNNFTRTLHIF